MGNYSVGNPAPEAFISKNKQRVKQFNGTVYLNDGDNFEIELFNPKSNKVLAKISLDGKRISTSGIILRPGERVFLERYIDSDNKFVFTTYQVNGENKQVQQAIKSNGNLKVDFYDEEIPTYWMNQPYYSGSLTIHPSILYYSTNTTTIDGTGSITPTYGSSTASATYFDTNNSTLTNCCSNNDVLRCGCGTPAPDNGKIETGTTEKGVASGQNFKYSYDNFNSYTTKVVEWKILPLSRKPITSGDIKVFCTSCGTRKRKQQHKFCPSCGTKFE